MSDGTKIECIWHRTVEALVVAPGVYKCPRCHERQQVMEGAEDGDEVEIQKPEAASVLKREVLTEVVMSMKPPKRAVIYWETCEDVLAGDTVINTRVRDTKSDFWVPLGIRSACRPFRNPVKDLPRLFGVALEDTRKGGTVPVHVLDFRHDEDDEDKPEDLIVLKECELVTMVSDDE